ncbi:hypothetical protein DLM76_03395 [Leptospira yasudae]|uniref:DUF1761 domain-containing protein n=1 Tax=Leptospira yasudae TaxID=2202201 RepID=A0A5F2ARV3_9LEPT|nr:DUF1761 domain-containing protein [Leptospira yasudae]RHX81443.1 hypothetical protein DLM77_04945 [Leptospira yasudae]RHX96018.1 hypothetical protein DLM76_03395 [Leptospira yasudae]TGK29830.1 DUF1761 domain-containing protein [Leptospira yasudae]TGL77079.1 DUF1761 domain-containing protein [Leptospira yasudae]TGL80378.1 DUF1761 domain-containing protein [Leptospira yasudae]
MFAEFYGIRPLSVILATVASFIVGMIWYTVFGKLWMKLQNAQEKDLNKDNMGTTYFTAIAISLVQFLVLDWMIGRMDFRSIGQSALLGGIIALFFLVLDDFSRNLWEPQRKSPVFIALNAGNTLLSFIVGGAVLGIG